MPKEMTCIVCPNSCHLLIDVENGKVLKVTGNKCVRGEEFAKQEIENPQRLFTTTVIARGLSLKMIPVRTNRTIPKAKLFEAMQAVRGLVVDHPVKVGESIVHKFIGLEVDLIATRNVQ